YYIAVPLLDGQGCIAGPKHNWVGIYWLAPTLLYTASFGLALLLSFKSMAAVLTTSMTLRIILSVRGSLVHGGSFAGGSTAATSGQSRSAHVISTSRAPLLREAQTYGLGEVAKGA